MISPIWGSNKKTEKSHFTMIKHSTRTLLFLTALNIVLITIAGCHFNLGKDNSQINNSFSTNPLSPQKTGNWYSIFFTEPGSPAAISYQNGPGEALAYAIQEARISVDVAVYALNLWEIRDALLDAQDRGIQIRMVIDNDNIDEPEVQALIEAKIPVVGDQSESLMHNKFFVLDRFEVWTGSMNPTLSGAFYDNNNMVRIRSPKLAETYLDEFEEMFVDGIFSRGSMTKSPQPEILIDRTRVEIYFSPEDEIAERIIELINASQESIYFLAYSFTSDDIAEAMIDQAGIGIYVGGVMDSTQYKSNIGTEYERLLMGGVDVRLDGNPDDMHHKVIIIDKSIVITGSYNFSASAEDKNDENVLIIHNPDIGAIFLEEFRRVYNEALE